MNETKVIQLAIPADKKAEWQEVNGKTVLVMVDNEAETPTDNRPVTERIKTFEDAMIATGMTIPYLSDEQLKQFPNDIVAFLKLRIICAALNGLTETTLNEFPTFHEDEYRWFPWFTLWTQDEIDSMTEEEKARRGLLSVGGLAYNGSLCGLSASYAHDGFSFSNANIGSRLALKTEELAIYCGRQFIELWADFCFKSKEE